MNRETSEAAAMYLDLLERVLTRLIIPERYRRMTGRYGPTKKIYKLALRTLNGILARHDLEIVRRCVADPSKREQGLDWPPEAETMIGIRRLENVRMCVASVVRDEVPGDLIETGVWRGGTAIFMRAALHAFGDTTRCVWVADSFGGLPKPDVEHYPADRGDSLWEESDQLAVSLEEVKANFQRYGFLDDRVRFLKGWFKDTLPTAPISRLSLARLDGDMYESTIQALEALYPKLSPGGFLIVDDFALAGCRAAVNDYRGARGISDEIQHVDSSGVFWRKTAQSAA